MQEEGGLGFEDAVIGSREDREGGGGGRIVHPVDESRFQ